MDNAYNTLEELFTAIADAIRDYSDITGPIVADDFPNIIATVWQSGFDMGVADVDIDGVRQEGYDDGYNVGYGEGYDEGEGVGWDNGYEEGYNTALVENGLA